MADLEVIMLLWGPVSLLQPPVHNHEKDDEDDEDDDDDDDADADDGDGDGDKEDDGDSDPVWAIIDCGHGDEPDEDEYFEPLAVDC